MPASDRSPSRSRTSGIRRWFVACVGVAACGGDAVTRDLPSIDGRPIDPKVVAHVAARDGIDEAAARERVVETLRLVAAARAETGTAELAPARREHLERTARARIVLHDDFEATHRQEDIAAGDPMLARARSEARFVHPQIQVVCQTIAEPPGRLAGDELAAHTADPAWLARAMERGAELRRHVEWTVPLDDADACDLFARMTVLEGKADDAQVVLRIEGPGGFDLDACAVAPGADGTCAEPRFAPEWVAAVREGDVPGLRGPFATRFGVHLVLVREVMPRNLPDDPGFEDRLREAIHPLWRTKALGEWIAGLRTRHAALVVSGAE
jgi:hypothetical protein